MARRLRSASWRAAVVAIAAIGVVAIGGTALAGHVVTGDVKSYTGCLVPKDGVIIKVKQGDSPASACTGGQTQVHLSGGDITKISVSGGLTLPNGGDNGEVTIALDPKFSLPQRCYEGDVAKWDDADKEWVCAEDEDTTYSEGTGIDVSASNAISIEPEYRIPGKACGSGKFATGFDQTSGAIQCLAPPPGAISVYAESQSSGVGIPSNEVYTDVVTLPVQDAGTYSITAIGNGSQTDQREWSIRCALGAGSSTLGSTGQNVGEDQPGGGIHSGLSMAMASVATLTGPTTLKVACSTADDGVGAEQFTIQAIRFG